MNRQSENRPARAAWWLPAVCAALLLSIVLPAAGDPQASDAEPAELITDRPDQTESSVTVPRGSFQLEVGWAFTREDEDGVRLETHEVPASLLRIGLSKKVELRIGWTGYVDAEARFGDLRASFDGAGDAELGAKIHLAQERGRRPEIALLVGTSVPVGDEEFSSDRFDPNLRLALAHTLSERVDLGYNLGLAFESGPGEDGDVHTLSSAFYTVALGFGLDEKWGAFVELYGDVPASASGDPAHSFDGGFTYLVRDNVQFDFAAGIGLSDAADDWFVGLGVSMRFPE